MSKDTDNTPSKLRLSITKELATERIMQKMSQEKLADKVGTKKSSISRIEKGGQNITVDYVALLAESLGKQATFVLREPPIEYGNSGEYSLKLYDDELIRFRLIRDGGLRADIIEVNEAKMHLMPPGLFGSSELTGEQLIAWLGDRVVPRSRALVGELMDSLGLDINDIKGIIDVCMGLSLNDSFWVTQVGFEGSYEDYNLYQNEFSEALSLISYTGGRYDAAEFRTSPELTTGGSLRKAWRFKIGRSSRAREIAKMERTGHTIWLYKGGSEEFANAGNEPYSEFYAAQVAQAMGIKHVSYDLERWKGILASKCELFTDIDHAYVPIYQLVTSGGIDAVIDYYKELGDDYYQDLASMIVFDAVIMNEDRHFGNFGLMRDNRTGEYVGTAPIFDNGMSLLCYGMRCDFHQDSIYAKTRTNPYGYGNDYASLCKRVIGPRQKKELRRLIGFEFTESDISNLPSWRLRALEKIIQQRVRELI